MKIAIIFLLAMLFFSSSPVSAGEPLGQWWMEPIKEWSPNEDFILWFRPESEHQILHFCLNSKAKWQKLDGESLTLGSWIHYWSEEEEVTFKGNLPDEIGQVTLITVTLDPLRCGKEGLVIQVRGEARWLPLIIGD